VAAARLGYLVGPSWLMAELEKVVLPYHLDTAKQIAGVLALTFVDEMEDRIARVVAERERIIEGLCDLGAHVWPSGANFVLFRFESPGTVSPQVAARSGDAIWQGLLDRSVLIRNCASWPRLDDCLRVTVG